MKYHLDQRIEAEIIALAKKHGVQNVILFGSRARGDNGERSDIDLAVSGGDTMNFSFDVDEKTSTLLRFDVIHLDSGVSEELRQEIHRDGITLYDEERYNLMKKYENFTKALEHLNEGIKLHPPYTAVEQAGIIGLFGICFELSWKVIKEALEHHGRIPDKIASPRTILKLAHQCGMISDEIGWLDILNTRNSLAHTYNDENALDAINKIKKRYFPLFLDLKHELDENWIIAEGRKR